jgi:hypothetical protein
VNENAALALGRLSAAPNRWPHVWATPMSFWSRCPGSTKDFTWGKESAFLGFINQVIIRNPHAMESCLGDYFQAIATLPKKSLHQEDYQIFSNRFSR